MFEDELIKDGIKREEAMFSLAYEFALIFSRAEVIICSHY